MLRTLNQSLLLLVCTLGAVVIQVCVEFHSAVFPAYLQRMPLSKVELVNTDHRRIYYHLYSPHLLKKSLSPIILIGGWSNVKEDWVGLALELAKDRTVLVPDVRGSGQTAHILSKRGT